MFTEVLILGGLISAVSTLLARMPFTSYWVSTIAEVGVFYPKTSLIKHSEISCLSPCNLIQGNSEVQSLSGTKGRDIKENSASENL